LADVAEGEPTKPSKPGFVGFEGSSPTESSNIETAPILEDAAESEPTKPSKPPAVFPHRGFECSYPAESSNLTHHILADVPEGEPTKPSKPGSVGFEGATSAESPEIVADPPKLARTSDVLKPMGATDSMGTSSPRKDEPVSRVYGSWAEWNAAELNRLFKEQGVGGIPGRIKAATVRHGERTLAKKAKSQKV
jgi:hypothetical protein